jgi:hypothetical protein
MSISNPGASKTAGGGLQLVQSFEDRARAAIEEICKADLTETAFATAIARLYADKLCYVPSEKQWLRFEPPRWVPETQERISTQMIGVLCGGIPSPKTRAGARLRKQLESQRHHAAIERMLRAKLEYKDGFDKDPYLAAGPTSVIDLRTGETRPGGGRKIASGSA